MKKIKRKVVALVLAGAMLLGMAITANAACGHPYPTQSSVSISCSYGSLCKLNVLKCGLCGEILTTYGVTHVGH